MPFEYLTDTYPECECLRSLFEKVANEVFAVENVPECSFTVSLVTPDEIRTLNRTLRGIDSETDVLSFPEINWPGGKTAGQAPGRLRRAYNPATHCPYIGDCAISPNRAREQAAQYGHSFEREMGYLLCHSLFHLLGYDHMNESDRAAMRQVEKSAMARAGLTRDGGFLMSDEVLFRMAEEALKNSYSPYSHFPVGACILTDTGRTYKGCNFENASYGATICAERCAASCAIADGERHFIAIAIAAGTEAAWPCGICRQVLREFGGLELRVIVGKAGSGTFSVATLDELLPHSFGPEDLLTV